MAQVGLTKAAELTGKSPSTITRRSNHKETKKRLGFTVNDDGEKLYDVAELERVFGTLHTPQKNDAENKDAIVRNSANTNDRNNLQQQLTAAVEAKNALLHDKIALLQTQLDDMRQDRNEWREQAKQSTRLLEDHRQKINPEKQNTDNGLSNPDTKQIEKISNVNTKVKKGFWAKLVG